MNAEAPEREQSPLEVLQRFRTHDYSLTDFVAARRERHPQREALVAEGRSWTWAQLEDSTARLASRLRGQGVGTGDRVLMMARNSPWHVFTLLACARIGAIFVPINPQLRLQESGYLMGHCRPALVLADDEALAREALASAAGQATVLPLADELLDVPAGTEPAAADPEATCIIIYTSGTTGFPKGVMHSQRSLVSAGEAFVERMHLQPSDRLLAILPMFHINAMFYSVAGAIAAGAVLLVERRFSASAFWQRVIELRATQVNVIEAIVTMLLNRPASEFSPGHPLRKAYGVRQAVMAPFHERFGVPNLVGGYAMTEIPGVLATPLQGALPPGCMGRLCRHPDPGRPWAECRVVDDAGLDVPAGTVGELVVRTPVLMQGYFGDQEQTRQAFRDGWFLTGDLVRHDRDGFFHFVARKKDIIRRRGENVAGPELDRVVGEHPGVLLAAAIGVPSDFGDEDILMVVKPREPGGVQPRDVVQWCRERLAAMKVPRYVVIVDDMPLTPTHKVAKAELKNNPVLRQSAVDFG